MGIVNESREQGRGRNGVFLPLLLLNIALVIWFGFQTQHLVAERSQAQELMAGQAQVLENAQQLRRQLDVLASGTRRLADSGNENALAITMALEQRGITITP